VSSERFLAFWGNVGSIKYEVWSWWFWGGKGRKI